MVSIALVAGTWLVHGLYNKLLGGSPRHLHIVQAIPGFEGGAGERILTMVGVGEVALAAWVLAGIAPRSCAAVQTVALLSMNGLELTYASHLLLWPAGLVPVNLGFLACAWFAAASHASRPPLHVRLQRHPVPIEAHFKECITLTYAVSAEVLRPLLPPHLELETKDGHGFVAVALVQTEALRPAGFPRALGQDFFLAGYRVFTTCRTPDGRRRRGLRILRSDADSVRMVVAGNVLTHYNYHRCAAEVRAQGDARSISVRTADRGGDLEIATRPGPAQLPAGSPFASWAEARRFAGPLPYTFDDEPATRSIVAIRATRANWHPTPVNVMVQRLSFFDAPAFHGGTPRLAAAFRVADIDYRWERGEVIPC